MTGPEQAQSVRRIRKEDLKSTRIGPTTEQALAGATAGHRMAGMEPTETDREIARRQLTGSRSNLSAAEHFRAMREHHKAGDSTPYCRPPA